VEECSICHKHRELGIESSAGGAIAADRNAVVTHLAVPHPSPAAPAGPAHEVYLGYLFVETRRHVPGLEDVSAEEAASVGRLAAAAARALRDCVGAEHVYAAVIGHGVEHFHLHLIPRYPGTPREFWWVRVDEWPGAPRGDATAVAELTAKLRRHVEAVLGG
jgi:histidine triad (HIT) family protein